MNKTDFRTLRGTETNWKKSTRKKEMRTRETIEADDR